MSVKGSVTTSDYLSYQDYKKLVQCLLDEKKYWWASYCVLSFCTGLRFSDVSRLKWSDVLDKRKIVIQAKKTNKTHVIPIGTNAGEYMANLYEKLGRPAKNQCILSGIRGKEGAVSIQYINREMKKWPFKYGLDIENISTHTFRKTFGRYVYEKSGRDSQSLLYLNRIFKHANLDTTIVYLGIRDEEISSVYNSIEI